MSTSQTIARESRRRYQTVLAAGWLIIALAAGAALLPLVHQSSGSLLIGGLLLAAGVAEFLAATLRKQARIPALAAAVVTIAAGILFLLRPTTSFLPSLYVITVWLILRAVADFVAALRSGGGTRRWSFISGLTDLLLGLLSLAGLSIATLIVTLFGPTQPVIASFAWLLAISFVTTGMYLLEVGNCEKEAAEKHAPPLES